MTDTDRFAAIEARAQALPEIDWRQRATDAGVIEDADGRPIAVLGTSGDVRLPAGEFLAHASSDVRWLIQQLKQASERATELEAADAKAQDVMEDLRGAINHAGSLMATSYVASIIGHTRVPGEGRRP